MASIGHSPREKERFLRETEFLLRLVPELAAARRQTCGWNEIGEKIAAKMGTDGWKQRNPEEFLWYRAKRVVYLAITGTAEKDAKSASIQTRVRNSPAVSAHVHADLSLWLAGELGVTISVTKRLVAVMLLGVAEAKGDWNTLDDHLPRL